MWQNGLNGQFHAVHWTPTDILGRSFHLLSAYWVPSKGEIGAFTPIVSLKPSRTLWGWCYYPPLYRWENWGAERKRDVFTTAHFLSGAWSPKSTYNSFPFKIASWRMIDCQSPLRTVIKRNPIFSMLLWVEPQIKAECQNSNKLLWTEVQVLNWGLESKVLHPTHRELSELSKLGALRCPGGSWE